MTFRKLLIATRNAGKIAEMRLEFWGQTFEIVGLDEVGVPQDFSVEEPAMTMEGNAIIKAIAYGKKSGLLTLAEDAGLEVDALHGRPGVLSARYAPGTDVDRYQKLLGEMENVSDAERGAQFRAVVALYDPQSEKIRTCEGVYRGVILRSPQGSEGFGYDPIFWNPELQKTNAELSKEAKNAISHRGKALRKANCCLRRSFSLRFRLWINHQI